MTSYTVCCFLRMITYERKYCLLFVKPSILFLISFKQWKIINTLNKLLFFLLYFFRLISFKLWKIIRTSKSYFSLSDTFFRFIYFKLWKIINTLNKKTFHFVIFFQEQRENKTNKIILSASGLFEFLFLSVYSCSILSLLYMYIKVIKQSSQIKPVYLLDVIERPVSIKILSFILTW